MKKRWLTTCEERDFIFDSLRAGATGCLPKNMPPAELVNTVRVHIQKVYERLHVHSRSQAIMRFLGK